jgi:hypothetical protein
MEFFNGGDTDLYVYAFDDPADFIDPFGRLHAHIVLLGAAEVGMEIFKLDYSN